MSEIERRLDRIEAPIVIVGLIILAIAALVVLSLTCATVNPDNPGAVAPRERSAETEEFDEGLRWSGRALLQGDPHVGILVVDGHEYIVVVEKWRGGVEIIHSVGCVAEREE